MSGKGSKRRPGDDEAYRSNWERIFKNPKITRCKTCGEETRTVRSGDEALDYCDFCERFQDD